MANRSFPALNPIDIYYKTGAKYPPHPGIYDGDIGIDIYADLDEPVNLLPLHGTFIDGGFEVAFGRGWAGLVVPRSSSNRKGLLVMTGVIDNGFAGVIGAEVRNISPDPMIIAPGDRIAQLILIAAFRPTPQAVVTLPTTDRGSNGWGSSGK